MHLGPAVGFRISAGDMIDIFFQHPEMPGGSPTSRPARGYPAAETQYAILIRESLLPAQIHDNLFARLERFGRQTNHKKDQYFPHHLYSLLFLAVSRSSFPPPTIALPMFDHTLNNIKTVYHI
jgi:hypothetical protein